MAQFTFTGDPKAPGTDPRVAEMDGIKFPFGEAVIVDDDELAEKLRRHSHFTEGKAPKVKADDTPKGEAPVGGEIRAIHRGRGNYSIMQDGDELVEGLSKAEAETFNAQTDEQRTSELSSRQKRIEAARDSTTGRPGM